MQALTRRCRSETGVLRFRYLPQDGYEAGVAAGPEAGTRSVAVTAAAATTSETRSHMS